MDTKTKIIFNASIGFSLGLIVGAIMFAALASYEDINDRITLLVQLLGSGLLGAVNMGSTIVYDFENWGIGQATLTHYAVALFSFLTANETLGWFNHSVLFVVCVIFTIVYIIIWLIQYAIYKVKVREMNKDLEAMLLKKNTFTKA